MNTASKILISQGECLEIDEISSNGDLRESHHFEKCRNSKSANCFNSLTLFAEYSNRQNNCSVFPSVHEVSSYHDGHSEEEKCVLFRFSTGTQILFVSIIEFGNRNLSNSEMKKEYGYKFKARLNSMISYFTRLELDFEKYSSKSSKNEELLSALYKRLSEIERKEFLQQLNSSALLLY